MACCPARQKGGGGERVRTVHAKRGGAYRHDEVNATTWQAIATISRTTQRQQTDTSEAWWLRGLRPLRASFCASIARTLPDALVGVDRRPDAQFCDVFSVWMLSLLLSLIVATGTCKTHARNIVRRLRPAAP